MTILYIFLAIVFIVVTTVTLSIEKNHTLMEQNYNSQKLNEENTRLIKESSKLNIGNLVPSYARDVNNQLNSYFIRVDMFKNYIQDLYSKDSIVPSTYSNDKFGVGIFGGAEFSKLEGEIKKIKPVLDLSNNVVGRTDDFKPYDFDTNSGYQAIYNYVSEMRMIIFY